MKVTATGERTNKAEVGVRETAAQKPNAGKELEKSTEQLQKAGKNVGQELKGMELQTLKTMEHMVEQAGRICVQDAENAKEQKKDLAELSQEVQDTRKEKHWEQKAELEAWKNILKWVPNEKEEVAGQIKELRAIYTKLLQEIIQNVPVQEQMQQLGKLRMILIYQLDLLMKASLADLYTLFSVYGTKNSLSRLENSLYFEVTGTDLSLERIRQGWADARRAGGRYVRNETDRGVGARLGAGAQEIFRKQQGQMEVYRRSGATLKIGEHHWREGEMLLHAVGKAGRTAGNGTGGMMFQMKELQAAERFAAAIGTKGGGLFARQDFSSRNEQIFGVLWTIEKGKAELFFHQTLSGGVMKQELEVALEQMTAARIQDAAKRVWKEQYRDFCREDVYAVYRYAMKRYHNGESIHKAIRDGFYYALKYFMQKSSESEVAMGESRQGFFQESVSKEGLLQDLKYGSRILEEDWKRYLAQMGYEDALLELTASLYGPWAAGVVPEKEPDDRQVQKGEAPALAGGLAAFVIIVILAIVFF